MLRRILILIDNGVNHKNAMLKYFSGHHKSDINELEDALSFLISVGAIERKSKQEYRTYRRKDYEDISEDYLEKIKGYRLL